MCAIVVFARVSEAASQGVARDLFVEHGHGMIVAKKMEGVLYDFGQTEAEASHAAAATTL